MASDHETRIAFLAEKLSSENRTNRTGGAATVDKPQLKYTSHHVHNELLSIMALKILRKIAGQIQESMFFTVMLDETTDCSNKEQVVLVFRWVDENLTAHEDLLDGTSLIPSPQQLWWLSFGTHSCE